MNWRRVDDGKDPKHYKEWRGGRGRYRIVWRDKVFGVTVSPGYQCCFRDFVPQTGKAMWELVDRGRNPIYRTFKAAKTACEKHANPDYKPPKKERKTKRKAPMRTCPNCGTKVHVRKKVCDCKYKFPEKVKR